MLLLLLSLSIFGATAQRVTDKVFMDITIGGRPAGTIVFGLYGDVAPKTVANFVGLAKGHWDGLHYKGTEFWRILPTAMAQGGDVTFKNTAQSGKSIYGTAFSDESFAVKFTKKYQLAMANAGRDTNKSQFFITLKKLSWLNGKHVIFGEVLEGQSVVDQIEKVGTWGTGKPKQKVVIADCGEMQMELSESVAVAQEQTASSISFVHVMAAFGFAVTAYGAFRHYVK